MGWTEKAIEICSASTDQDLAPNEAVARLRNLSHSHNGIIVGARVLVDLLRELQARRATPGMIEAAIAAAHHISALSVGFTSNVVCDGANRQEDDDEGSDDVAAEPSVWSTYAICHFCLLHVRIIRRTVASLEAYMSV